MGDKMNRYRFLKNRKLMIYLKKKLLLDDGRFFILLNHHVPFKLMGTVPNGFFLISMSNPPVTLRVGVGFISKKLVGSFRVNGLG